MVFSSLIFIYIFLPITLVLYYIVPRKFRNPILLITSLVFYGWGEPIWVSIMIFSSILDFTCSNIIEKNRGNKRIMRGALLASVVLNLGILFFFKYTDFIIDSIPFLSGIPRLNISLPIGISFYTFQTMSCTIDVYRNEAKAQKNIVNFATYVTLFPQLIAGPIVRYKDIANQLTARKENLSHFSEGIKYFIIGLCKKVLLANQFGALWEQVKGNENLPALSAFFGIICFAFQIYFDFSGYSDMAVGLGKMFGFDLPINFKYPYTAKSITEFWRKWHITLGTWFREYVYIPLGGNRKGKFTLFRNIFIVWLLTGLWHGASWNFVLWGLFYGVILLIEKLFLNKWLLKAPSFVQHLYSVAMILFGWILFAFTDFTQLCEFFKALTGANGIYDNWLIYQLISCAVLIIAGIIGSTELPKKMMNKITAKLPVLIPILCAIGLLVSTAFLVNSSYNPFLYFRF